MMLSTVLTCSRSCPLLLVLPVPPKVAALTTSATDSSLQDALYWEKLLLIDFTTCLHEADWAHGIIVSWYDDIVK